MPLTSRMKWSIPKENADPWFDPFVALMEDVDESVYAAREDRNVVAMCTGCDRFDSTSGLLSWDAAIEFASSNGTLWTLAAGSDTVGEGESMYVTLTRYPTSNVTLTTETTSNLAGVAGASDEQGLYVLCVRRNNVIYWRPGLFRADKTKGLFASVVIDPAGGADKRLAYTNVSAIARPLTGTYTVTFAHALPTGYTPVVNVTVSNTGGTLLLGTYNEVNSTSITVYVQNAAGTLSNSGLKISVTVFLALTLV